MSNADDGGHRHGGKIARAKSLARFAENSLIANERDQEVYSCARRCCCVGRGTKATRGNAKVTPTDKGENVEESIRREPD